MRSFLVYLFELLFLLISLTNGKSVSIELTPHKLTTPIEYTVANTFTLAKTGSSVSVKLTNSLDRIYTGKISIGTPSFQTFDVVFDTGSADLWIFSSYHTCITANDCEKDWNSYQCGSDNHCCFFNDIMNDYDHNNSTTYGRFSPQKDWSITYGKGSANGYLSSDTVTIGGLTANNQVFAEATSWSDLLISCVEPMSGILGFAMKAASEDGSNTLIESLYQQNEINSKLFSISLKGDDQKSVLVIGEPNDNYYKNKIVYGNIIQPTTTGMWFTQLTGIIVTETELLSSDVTYNWLDECTDDSPCLSLIDTGTSYITMPSSVYNKLMKYLLEFTSSNNVNCIEYKGDFMCKTSSYVPDDDLPYIWFQLGGYGFNLKPSDYMLTGGDSCAIDYDCMGISTLDTMGDHTYILGDTFIRQYYIVFDESNYRMGIGSNDDVLYEAIPRPPITDFWYYIQIISYIAGVIGVIVCISASLWKLRKPQSSFWNKQMQMRLNNMNNNNINNDNDNDDNNNVIDDKNKNYKNKISVHKEVFLDNIDDVNIIELDSPFEDDDHDNNQNDVNDDKTTFNQLDDNYQQLK